MQLDQEIFLSRLYDKATTEVWRDMAMISGVMTRHVRLITHQIHHLRVVCAICLISCAPALDLQIRPLQFNSGPDE
jgi:hypothetical protein